MPPALKRRIAPPARVIQARLFWAGLGAAAVALAISRPAPAHHTNVFQYVFQRVGEAQAGPAGKAPNLPPAAAPGRP